jgi:hypothetical protein
MALEFNGSRTVRELEALDVLLKGKSDEYKGRVLQYVRDAKVDANDSTFLLMAALGNLDIALIDLPKEIEANGKKYSAEIDKITTELRMMFQLAAKQVQAQIKEIERVEKEVKREIDRVPKVVAESIAESKKSREENLKLVKVLHENYQKNVEENRAESQRLIEQLDKIGRQLKEESQLRMSQPWKNAVNLPSWILLILVVVPLMSGLFLGSNLVNKDSANIDKLRYQIYDTFKKPQEDAAKEKLIEEENKKVRKRNRNKG